MEYVCLLSPLVALLSKVKCRFSRVNGIVIPRKSGKTHLAKVLEKKNYIILDIENSVKLHISNDELRKLEELQNSHETQSYNNYYFPICRKFFNQLQKDFKHKSFLVLSSDPELLKYLGVKNILYLTPSNKLYNQIIQNMSLDEVGKRLLQASRDTIIQSSGKHLTAYDTFENLIQIVSNKFGLHYKI